MKLTEQEKQSPLWVKIKSYLEERIQGHRTANDGVLSELETARLRGRIAELKVIIAAEQSPASLDGESPPGGEHEWY